MVEAALSRMLELQVAWTFRRFRRGKFDSAARLDQIYILASLAVFTRFTGVCLARDDIIDMIFPSDHLPVVPTIRNAHKLDTHPTLSRQALLRGPALQ